MENSAKEYLMQVKRYEAIIKSKQEERAWLYGIATNVTGAWREDAYSTSSGSQNNLENIMAKVADLDAEINSEIDNLIEKRKEIVNMIDRLNDLEEIRVLRLLYIGLIDEEEGTTKYPKWKWIAKIIHTSVRTAQRIHGRALKNFSEILKVDAVCR